MKRLLPLFVWTLAGAHSINAAEIHEAVSRQDLEAISSLWRDGRSCEQQDENGNTPFARAVAESKNRAVDRLIWLGANPNVPVTIAIGGAPVTYRSTLALAVDQKNLWLVNQLVRTTAKWNYQAVLAQMALVDASDKRKNIDDWIGFYQQKYKVQLDPKKLGLVRIMYQKLVDRAANIVRTHGFHPSREWLIEKASQPLGGFALPYGIEKSEELYLTKGDFALYSEFIADQIDLAIWQEIKQRVNSAHRLFLMM